MRKHRLADWLAMKDHATQPLGTCLQGDRGRIRGVTTLPKHRHRCRMHLATEHQVACVPDKENIVVRWNG